MPKEISNSTTDTTNRNSNDATSVIRSEVENDRRIKRNMEDGEESSLLEQFMNYLSGNNYNNNDNNNDNNDNDRAYSSLNDSEQKTEEEVYAEERERERLLQSVKLEAEEGVSRDDDLTKCEENLRKNYRPFLRDVRRIRVMVPRILSIFRTGLETNNDNSMVSFPLTVVRVKENVEYFTQNEQIARINFAKIIEIMRGTDDPWIQMLTQIIDCLL